ncbi:MAG: ribonuclease H-like domain-containing protein [Patescibacteria group bacterium]
MQYNYQNNNTPQRTLAFDIETVGVEWEEVSAPMQESLQRSVKKNSVTEEEFVTKMEEAKNNLVFSPLTGKIIALSIYDVEHEAGAVYFEAPSGIPGKTETYWEEDGVKYFVMSEKEIVTEFWRIAEHYNTFLTFNGHAFDVPYTMMRSALHGIKPSKNLMTNRFLSSQKGDARHIDLFDQFTFYGTLSRKGFSLDGLSSAFGITSPKAEGVSGDQVGPLFKQGEYLKIAKYNAADSKATGELYKIWEQYLKF